MSIWKNKNLTNLRNSWMHGEWSIGTLALSCGMWNLKQVLGSTIQGFYVVVCFNLSFYMHKHAKTLRKKEKKRSFAVICFVFQDFLQVLFKAMKPKLHEYRHVCWIIVASAGLDSGFKTHDSRTWHSTIYMLFLEIFLEIVLFSSARVPCTMFWTLQEISTNFR